MEKILAEIIAEFQKGELPELFERTLEIATDTDKVITLVGLRRSGKTYYFYHLIKNMLKKLPKERIFYINFEDERLSEMKKEDLSKIVEIYYKYNPNAKKMYLFLDELQDVDGWEKFIRRLSEKKHSIFITGSSSKLLSKEIATSLRGRTLSYHLYTLSFKEFLNSKGKDYSSTLIERERGEIKKLLEEYISFGGFPEILEFNEDVKTRTIKEYLDLIVYRDLIERHRIKNINAIKFLIKSLVKSFSKDVSISRIHKFFKSQNIQISKNKIYEYFSFLEDINFVFTIKKYSKSPRAEEGSIPKIYISDTGFAKLYGIDDKGRLIENIVALELKRRKHYSNSLLKINYWRDYQDREVDFVLSEKGKINKLIQVCYNIEDFETKEREIKSLLKASEELKCGNLLVVTWDLEKTEIVKGKTITYIPLWKWLLEA